MVKPKRTQGLADEFAPRPSDARQGGASMKETLAGKEGADPLRHLTIQVPESLRTQLRETALREHTSVRQIVTEAIEGRLKERP